MDKRHRRKYDSDSDSSDDDRRTKQRRDKTRDRNRSRDRPVRNRDSSDDDYREKQRYFSEDERRGRRGDSESRYKKDRDRRNSSSDSGERSRKNRGRSSEPEDRRKGNRDRRNRSFSSEDRRRRSRDSPDTSDDSDSDKRRHKKSKRRNRSPDSRERTRRTKDKKGKDRRKRSESPPKRSKKQVQSDSSSESSEDSDVGKASGTKASSSADISKRAMELLEQKRKEKELVKVTETPEEKRMRRLLKKERKERKRKERMGWDKDYMHYTNTDNPFGDNNLLDTFVWSKKLEKEGLDKTSREELEKRNRLKQEENRIELEKVKKRRQEFELERTRREEELQFLQRQKEAAQFREWEKQEDIFHLEQALLRSKIRIQDGRAKPIDLLAKYINTEEEDFSVEMLEPYACLNGLVLSDLEDLLEDIKVYMELEKGKNLDYWNDITMIVEDELQKLRKLQEENFGDRREGINAAVIQSTLSVLKKQTYAQLCKTRASIEAKINSGEEGIDIGYWESLLRQTRVFMAKSRLKERHKENLQRKLMQLKQEQGVSENPPPPLFPIVDRDSESGSPQPSTSGQNEAAEEKAPERSETVVTEEELLSQCVSEYETGGFSPKLFQPSDLDPGIVVVEVAEDLARLQFARQKVVGTNTVEEPLTVEERAFDREARKGMTNEEGIFSVEASCEQQDYLWSDKYRPRKPRYFNRVHTGFEWNKYNQTHYDMDNPPPKIVQGYKFNIFYPDLINRNDDPKYMLTPCDDNKDFALLRFHAGPPYEDIAFKIVNREWEFSYKRGFRCQFQNNIFQLWFHFKRYRYRR